MKDADAPAGQAAREPRRRARARRALPPVASPSSRPSGSPTPTRPTTRPSSRGASTWTARSPKREVRGAARGAARPRRWASGSARLIEKRLGRQARAVRHLVRRLQAARQVHRGRARRADAEALPDRRGLRRRHPAPAARPRLRAGARAVPRRPHRGRPGARRRPRARRRPARRQGAPAHARRPAAWTTRATTSRSTSSATTSSRSSRSTTIDHTLLRACRTPPSPRRWRSCSRRATWSCSGLAPPDRGGRELRVLDEFWSTREIAGVALVDMGVWHWLYDHPGRDARRSSARPWSASRGTSGTATTRRSSGERDVALLGDLLAHDRLRPLPARLPARPSDRVPDRGALPQAAGTDGRRVRAHLPARLDHARRLDAPGGRRARSRRSRCWRPPRPRTRRRLGRG